MRWPVFNISVYQLTSEDNKSNYRPRALVAEEGYSMKRRKFFQNILSMYFLKAKTKNIKKHSTDFRSYKILKML